MKRDQTITYAEKIQSLEEKIQSLEARVEQLELNSITCLSALRRIVEDKADELGVPPVIPVAIA